MRPRAFLGRGRQGRSLLIKLEPIGPGLFGPGPICPELIGPGLIVPGPQQIGQSYIYYHWKAVTFQLKVIF